MDLGDLGSNLKKTSEGPFEPPSDIVLVRNPGILKKGAKGPCPHLAYAGVIWGDPEILRDFRVLCSANP